MKRMVFGALLFAAACSDEPTDQLVPSSADAGVAVRDAGTAVVPRDGGTSRDAGPDRDAGPVRTLVAHRLLGDSPPGNLVMNPNLTSLSTVGPFFNSSASTTRHFADTPTKQPVAEIAGRDSAFLLVQSAPGSTTASIWLGRAAPLDGSEEVLILGLSNDQLEAVVQLTPIAGEARIIDGLNWQRFEAVTNEALVGSSFLVVTNDAREPLFATGPSLVVRQADTSGVAPGSRPVVLRPSVRKATESLIAKHRAALMDRFEPTRPTPRLPSKR